MSLEEMEDFRRSMHNCPKCGSTEGFWITSNRERSYVQCKHCAAILEIVDFYQPSDKSKGSRPASRILKL